MTAKSVLSFIQQRSRQLALGLGLVLAAHAVWAGCDKPPTRPNERYSEVPGSNGSEVRDGESKLIWQRCVVGKTWDTASSKCTGNTTSLSWDEAKDLGAKTPSLVSKTPGWRLPTFVELLSLVDLSCTNPAVNVSWFADSSAEFLWSGSSYKDIADYAWGLKQNRGEITYDSKVEPFQVRLVRVDR